MRLSTPLVIALLLASAAGANAAPSEAIGSAVTVVNYVTATLDTDGDERRLSSGDDVRRQELIETDADSRSEIELNDRTKLALGPGSRLLLDKFVYDPDLSGGAIVMSLVKGTFRFITGIAAKPAYVIRTPAASITVRGTIFDVFVHSKNETWLLLIEGGVEVCTESGKCLVHDQPGKLIRITAEDVEKPMKWTKLSRKQDISFETAFPFVVTPPYIDPTPIFTRDDIVLADDEDNYEPPKQTKPAGKSDSDDYTPPPRTMKESVYRDYPREVHYREPRRSRGRQILKKGIKVGIGVGIGVGVGYGIAKALRRRRY